MAQMKQCYYALLDLERTCAPEEIKRSYRKLALKWHPDKAAINALSDKEATAKFQAIQEAYSTLSDPQERAWYDSHREQILYGILYNVKNLKRFLEGKELRTSDFRVPITA